MIQDVLTRRKERASAVIDGQGLTYVCVFEWGKSYCTVAVVMHLGSAEDEQTYTTA